MSEQGPSGPPVLQLMADRLLTWEDVRAAADGARHRYQLLDGQVLISPGPDLAHQRCVGRLYTRLTAAAPSSLEVVLGPYPFIPEPAAVLQPDLLVVRHGTAWASHTEAAPLLVVEVLSPSSATTDRTVKRALYARFGVGHYWLVDPAGPTVQALDLDVDGGYVERQPVASDVLFSVQVPFAVQFTPAELVGG